MTTVADVLTKGGWPAPPVLVAEDADGSASPAPPGLVAEEEDGSASPAPPVLAAEEADGSAADDRAAHVLGAGRPKPVWVYELPDDPPELTATAAKQIAKQIWKKWMTGFAPARGRRPEVTLFLGPPGSGKTTLAKKWAAGAGVPYLDHDDIAELSPDYAHLKYVRDVDGKSTGVQNAHRELQAARQMALASHLALERVWGGRYDHAMQWQIGGADPGTLAHFVRDGYRVAVVWVRAPTKTVVDRYWARARQTGRHYASGRADFTSMVRREQEQIASAAPLLARMVDAFYVYDASRPVPTRGVTLGARILPGDDTAGALANYRAAAKSA